MLVLKRRDNKEKYALIKNGTYKIGRVSGDIIIKDPSISRRHAEITINKDEISIKDCGSKYLTRYKDRILHVDESITLEDKTMLCLGEVLFMVYKRDKFVISTTGMKNNVEIEKLIEDLEFGFSKEWNERCTHLTTNEIVVTLKLLHALMDNKKIVTADYWKVFSSNMKEGHVFPDAKKFFPPVSEVMINPENLEFNPKRSKLFKGKVFGFWKEKRMKNMEELIKKAGGTSIFLDIKTMDKDKLVESMDRCIVMDPEDPNVEKKFPEVFSAYRNENKRIIPVQEIIFALLQCSCEENCNPMFDRKKTVFAKQTQKDVSSRMIVCESETQYSETCGFSQIIPASYDQPVIDFNVTTSKTQVVSEETQIPTKLMKMEETSPLKVVDLSVSPSTSRDVEVVIDDISSKDVNLSVKASTSKAEVLDEEVQEITSSKEESLKRRRDQEVVSPLLKKVKIESKNLKINPFSLITKAAFPDRKEDDFVFQKPSIPKKPLVNFDSIKTEVKVETTNEENNSNFEETISRKRCREENKDVQNKKRKESSTNVNNITIDISKLDNSSYKIQSGDWIDSSMKKKLMKKEENDLDEEIRDWVEKFNDSVRIVVKDLTRKDKVNEVDYTLDWSRDLRAANYKKFKKVPVRKSNVVIKCSELLRFGQRGGFSDDDDIQDT